MRGKLTVLTSVLGVMIAISATMALGAEVSSPKRVQKFVPIRKGRELYVDYIPARAGKPMLVLVNGLTYSTKDWNELMPGLVKHAEKSGNGILRYDPMGMGKTLLKYAPINYVIPIEDQVEDLAALLDQLKIRGSVHLAGLSYGGGLSIAFSRAYPSRVQSLILMAPYTEPMPSQDNWIRSQIAATRLANPFNPATDDELYDYFLRVNVYSTYPTAEPSISENPYKLEAVFRMVQGVRKMNVNEFVGDLPDESVHLMIAENDQYIPRSVLDKFWKALPKNKRLSNVIMDWTEHKIPEASPRFTAGWINLILDGDERIARGRVFKGHVLSGVAESGSLKITLPKE